MTSDVAEPGYSSAVPPPTARSGRVHQRYSAGEVVRRTGLNPKCVYSARRGNSVKWTTRQKIRKMLREADQVPARGPLRTQEADTRVFVVTGPPQVVAHYVEAIRSVAQAVGVTFESD